MNILYVNTCFWGGGAEKVARQLYYGMKDMDTKTYFIAGRYQRNLPEDVEVLYNNFFERVVSAILGIANHNFLFGTVLARKKIIDFVKKNDIDIIHFHNIHGNYIGPNDIKAIKKSCNNIIFTMHDMWLITGCCPYGMSCNQWKDDNRCHMCKGNESLKRGTRRASLYLKSKIKNISRIGSCYVSPSKWLMDCCSQSYLSSESKQWIPNGVDINQFHVHDMEEVRKKHNLPLDKHIILFSAHQINSPYKGIQYLTEALLNLPDKESYFLLIVGKGRTEGLDAKFKVYHTGYVRDGKVMNELYSASDIFVLPSMADTFPLTMLESMASGTPVLAFRTGGIPEAVNDEVGWCVDAGNSQALSAMIVHIFEKKEEYCRKAQQCRRYVENHFSEELMLERYRGIYKHYGSSDREYAQSQISDHERTF